jgi:hypothetical protein
MANLPWSIGINHPERYLKPTIPSRQERGIWADGCSIMPPPTITVCPDQQIDGQPQFKNLPMDEFAGSLLRKHPFLFATEKTGETRLSSLACVSSLDYFQKKSLFCLWSAL